VVLSLLLVLHFAIIERKLKNKNAKYHAAAGYQEALAAILCVA
jgi:hypothetical protein